MSVEKNKALVRRWLEMKDFHTIPEGKDREAEISRIVNKVVDELFDPGFIMHLPHGSVDIAEFKKTMIMRMLAETDMRFTIDEIIAEGDMVATRYTMHDTHKEEFFGIPPSGKQIAVTTMSFTRVANGKFKEVWIATDVFSLLHQLSGVPVLGKA